MNITLDSVLKFPMSCPYRQYIIDDLCLENPKYKRAKLYQSRAVSNIPEKLFYFFDDYENAQTLVPIGKKEKLFNFCNQCSYNCPIADNRSIGQWFIKKPVDLSINLRKCQELALDSIRNKTAFTGLGILILPTGGGKTILSFLMSYESNLPTLFITHTVDLAQQTLNSYEEFFNFTPGFIGDGKFDIKPQFTIAIIDSIYSKKCYEELNKTFGMVIFDELHMLAPESCIEVVNNLSIKYKIGVTATIKRGDGLTPVLSACLGDIIHTTSIKEAQEEQALVPLNQERIVSNFISSFDEEKLKKKKSLFNSLLKEASLDSHRNKLIAQKTEELCSKDEYVLLVLQNIDQCLLVAELLKESSSVRFEIFVGQIGKKKFSRQERKEIVTRARTGETNCLITVQLAGIGLDVPRLTSLIMDRKVTDPSTVTQIVGRVVRSSPGTGKQFATVYDLEDVNCNVLLRQLEKRSYVYYNFRKH